MREFDDAIKINPDIVFYARYVDDIIVIYTPKPNTDVSIYIDNIRKIANSLSLTLNETDSNKTKTLDLTVQKNGKFDYLGYSFLTLNGSVEIELSGNKKARYKTRIKSLFDDFITKNISDKNARKLFIKRIRFITGNTRLSNNKNNALVGVFFSNSLLTNSSSLKGLDDFLKHQISRLTLPTQNFKSRIENMSFQKGWSQKTFYKLTPRELQEIVQVWKDDA